MGGVQVCVGGTGVGEAQVCGGGTGVGGETQVWGAQVTGDQ